MHHCPLPRGTGFKMATESGEGEGSVKRKKAGHVFCVEDLMLVH